MKLIRIIPLLLIKDNFLIKGEKFENHKYVGDIYNAVKIFSEKSSHEIILLDINASQNKKTFNIEIIKKIKKINEDLILILFSKTLKVIKRKISGINVNKVQTNDNINKFE